MTPTQLKTWEEEHKQLMAEFLAKGGQIQQIPTGVLASTGEARKFNNDGIFQLKTDEWIDTKAAALTLDCHPTVLYRLADAGSDMEARRVGKRLHWKKADVERVAAAKVGKFLTQRKAA